MRMTPIAKWAAITAQGIVNEFPPEHGKKYTKDEARTLIAATLFVFLKKTQRAMREEKKHASR